MSMKYSWRIYYADGRISQVKSVKADLKRCNVTRFVQIAASNLIGHKFLK